MWQASYEKTYAGITREEVWAAWCDVNNWAAWDADLEFASLTGPFEAGANFVLKPKGGPQVKITLTEVVAGVRFTDIASFPLATMHDFHELEETPEGLTIRSRIWVTGPLSWVWRKLVAEGVAASVPVQVDALVDLIRRQKGLA